MKKTAFPTNLLMFKIPGCQLCSQAYSLWSHFVWSCPTVWGEPRGAAGQGWGAVLGSGAKSCVKWSLWAEQVQEWESKHGWEDPSCAPTPDHPSHQPWDPKPKYKKIQAFQLHSLWLSYFLVLSFPLLVFSGCFTSMPTQRLTLSLFSFISGPFLATLD